MAITKNSACGLTATGYFTNETDYVLPGSFDEISLMYYTVVKSCDADAVSKYTILQNTLLIPMVSFSLTSGSFPGYVVGTATINYDRTLTFVSGTRVNNATTVTLNNTNWNTVSINTNNPSVTYTYNITAKDLANNTYTFVFSFSVLNNTYASSSALITMLNTVASLADTTTYFTEPQYASIDDAGTITFNSYAFDGTTSDVIGNGVFSMNIYQHGFTNIPNTSVGVYTLDTITSETQCLLMYCNLLCNAVQASTVENVDKTELWALLEALKQADICTTCNSDLCNIIEYIQAIINKTDCKC